MSARGDNRPSTDTVASPAARIRASWGLWLAGLLGLIAYLGMVRLDATARTLREGFTPQTIAWYVVAIAAFLVALWWNERHPIPLLWLWAIPIVFRLLLLATTPTLSDDVYRYLWDGHVATEGINPYRYPIDAPQLDRYEIPARDLANNPSLSTPYLPAAQLVFATSALLLPSEPLVMQVVMVVFDLLTALVLVRLLKVAGLPERRVLLYLWNPLVIVEVAHGAHVDALMVALAVWAVLLTMQRAPPSRRWAAPVVLGLATLTRPLPVLLLPVLWWRWSWYQRWIYAATSITLVLPFALAVGWGLRGEPTGTGVFASAREYLEEFRFNSGIYHWLEDWFAGRGAVDPAGAARWVAGLVLVAVVAWVWWRARRADTALGSLRLMSLPLMGYVLLTPTLHPWYILILVAFLPFLTPAVGEPAQRWLTLIPWVYLAGALVFSYLTYLDPLQFGEIEWVRRLEWLPTLGLLGLAIGLARSWARAPASEPR